MKVAKSLDEVKQYAQKILGMQLVTHQTGPEGKMVQQVLVEAGCDIDRELYLGIIVDRSDGELPTLMLDDGTERLPLRIFDRIPGLDSARVGTPVLIVGRPRQFDNDRFLVPAPFSTAR